MLVTDKKKIEKKNERLKYAFENELKKASKNLHPHCPAPLHLTGLKPT